MARGLNKVMIIGNLGKDPETQYMPSGVGVTKFPLATTEVWKDKQTGELKEHTEWMNVEVWGKAADACAEYLRKGSKVYVEGSLRTDKWQDKEGIERWTTKIRSSNVMFLDGKQGGDRINAPSDSKDQDGMPPRSRSQQDDFDDDIPF